MTLKTIFPALLLALISSTAWSVTYTLPADAGTGPFALCVFGASTVSCAGNVSLGNNDDIVLTESLTLSLGGSFTTGNNFNLNQPQLFSFTLTVGGNVDIGNNSTVNGDITAGGNVDFGNSATIEGDVTAGTSGEINLGNNSDVSGSCTAINPVDYTPYCSAVDVCFNFNSGLPSGWAGSGAGQFGVNSDTGAGGTDSLFLRNRAVEVTTTDFDFGSASSVDYTVWVQRGDDNFSEDPDAGEDLQLEYRDSSGNWQIISTFTGSGTAGEVFTPTLSFNSTQLHNQFALRFNKIDGDNGDFDYWHIDDVCLTSTATVSLPTPVIEYRFDELSWDGTADEVSDSSGNNNNATADSATNTTTVADAVMCQAASFNGAGQHIDTPTLTTLESTSSMSFWIKTNQTGNTINWSSPMLTGVEESGGQNDIFWGWINESGNIGMTQSDDDTDHSSISINNDTYRHVALTFDEPSRAVAIYIDGVLDRTYTTGSDSIDFSFSQLGYARRTDGSAPNYLDAEIDEFLVFDEVLNGTQVNEIYSLQSSGRNLDGTTRNCITVLTPLAWFKLDEISAGQYFDDSSNNYTIDTVGSATPVDESLGRVCAANTIGNNNSQAEIDGLLTDIRLGPSNDVGETGAVSFWFNSNNNWNDFNRRRMLWDASSNNDFFTLQLDENGRLVFAFEDEAGGGTDFRFRTNPTGFIANSWHHISLSWDFPNQSIIFYIDGVAVANTQINGNWGDYDAMPDINTLLFGDSRNDDSDGGVDQSANGRFDEIYVFNQALTPANADEVFRATHPCLIDPIAYYQFEEAAWTGATGEVEDETTNGLDLTNDLNNGTLTAGRICTGVFFDGVQGRMSRPNDPVLDDYSTGMGATVWINPTEIPASGNHTIINKVNVYGLRLTPTGEIRLNYYDSFGASQVLTTSGANISPNSWTHVAFAVSTTTQRVWVDGSLLVDNSTATTLIGTTTGVFQVGANTQNSSNSTFAGRIDELRIYNEEITQTEVSRDLAANHSCDTSLVGWYQMEESVLNGTSGEVIDYSGNRNNGLSEGATAGGTGYICQGADIPQNNAQGTREGIQSNVDLDSDLGPQGTIMLWYNSAQNWNTGRRRLLIDASTDTSDPSSADNKYFFLEIEGDGSLRYEFEDRDDDNDFFVAEATPPSVRTAGQWYHVAITFDFTIVDSSSNSQFAIFVDGVRVANTITARNQNDIDGQPNFQRVHFGDNASNYNYVPDASANGTIDEMRLYNRILTAPEIVTASMETHPCDGEAIVRYQFEETSYNGTPDEVQDDSGFNYDGVTFGDVQPRFYASGCRAADFANDDASPTTINAIATPMDVDRDIGNEGSIMMWLKPDNDFGSFSVERNLFDASRNPREFYGSVLAGGELRFVLTDASNNRFTLTSSAISATSDDWTHVAFTWNFNSQTFNLFVDGVLEDTQPGVGVFNIADLPTLYLGDSQNNRTGGTANSWRGLMEDARIYNYARTTAEVNLDIADFTPCVSLLDHFDIDESGNDGTAINCAPEPITITAKLADDSDAIGFVGTLNLSTSTGAGDWNFSGPAANNFSAGTANSGTATIDLTAADAGVLSGLTLANYTATTLNVNVSTSASATETTGSANAADDPSITYQTSGFQISAASAPNVPITTFDMIAGTNSADLLLRAVTTDPATGVCTGLFSGNETVNTGSTCTNPGSCAAGEQLSFVQTSSTEPIPNPQNQNAGTNTDDIAIDFGANSTATYQINASDVGEHEHTFTYNDTNFSFSTNITYFARPNSIVISRVENSASQVLDGSNSVIAGENFTVLVEGRDASTPTPRTYPSFNRIDFDPSTPGVTDPYPINFSATLTAPTVGTNLQAGVLTESGTWAVDGRAWETDMSFDEIQEIALGGTLNDFWNGQSGVFNYVVPDVTVSEIVPAYVLAENFNTSAWTSLTSDLYQGMPSTISNIQFDIQAYRSDNTLIQNYDNTQPFATSVTGSTVLNKSGAYVNLGGNITSDSPAWNFDALGTDDTAVNVTGSITNVQWAKKAVPDVNDVPTSVNRFDINLSSITDEFGLCFQTDAVTPCDSNTTFPLSITPVDLSVVRLSVPEQVNGDGQTANIPLTLEVLGVSGTDIVFTTNTNEDDFDSTYLGGFFLPTGGTCTLSSQCPAPLAVQPGTILNTTNSDNELENGEGFLNYSLASPDNGLLQIEMDIPAWLEWDWDGDGTPEAPQTLLLFGDYQGQAPVLFTRPGFR